MAYSTVTATNSTPIPAADINQLQENIDILKGGTAGVTPTKTVSQNTSDISTNAGAISDIEAEPKDGILRQAIDNASFQVDQYELLSSTPVAITNDYMIDRFVFTTNTVTGNVTLTDNVIRLIASSTASGLMFSTQIIPAETVKVLKRNNSQITFSAIVTSDNSNAQISAAQPTGLAYTRQTIATVSMEETLSLTIDTSDLDETENLELYFGIMSGTGTAVTITTAEYFEFTQPQLCIGSKRLPFEPRLYSQELAECQRYAWSKIMPVGYNFTVGRVIAFNSTTLYAMLEFNTMQDIAHLGSYSNLEVLVHGQGWYVPTTITESQNSYNSITLALSFTSPIPNMGLGLSASLAIKIQGHILIDANL